MNFSSIWNRNGSSSCDPVIGIDFGTSNSCVAVWRPDKKHVKIIKNKSKPTGKRTTSSTILFDESFDDWHIGSLVVDENSTNIISNIKPCLGADATTTANEIVGFKTTFDKANDKLQITCFDSNDNKRQYSPEQLASHILIYLKECAEEYLTRKPFKSEPGDEPTDNNTNNTSTSVSTKQSKSSTPQKVVINKVVIGIPANYTERKKDAIRSAANMAGFDEVHLMIESTAAAMSYGLLVAGSKSALVVDIGGGTTDLTVMRIDEGRYQVEATGGHVSLGGANMDLRLMELVKGKIREATRLLRTSQYLYFDEKGLDATLGRSEVSSQLLQMCKVCKEELTDNITATITIPHSLLNLQSTQSQTNSTKNTTKTDTSKNTTLDITITRVEFEHCIADLTDLVVGTVVHTLSGWIEGKRREHEEKDEGGEADSTPFIVSHLLDEVVLVGGSSRVPAVQTALRIACERVGLSKFSRAGDPSTNGSVFEFCTSVNPDEVVAEGLAIRGAILSSAHSTDTLKNILMMDCLAMSVGLLSWCNDEVKSVQQGSVGSDMNINLSSTHTTIVNKQGQRESRVFDVILKKGDKIPARASKTFTLADSRQKFVSLDMYEQFEEQRLVEKKTTNNTNNNSASDDNNTSTITTYSYSLISTRDVPVPPPVRRKGSKSDPSSPRQIEVIFRLDEMGFLSYEVVDCLFNEDSVDAGQIQQTEGGGMQSVEKEDVQSARSMNILIAYIICMGMLYLAVKMLLVEVEVKGGGGSVGGSVEGGGVIDEVSESVVQTLFGEL